MRTFIVITTILCFSAKTISSAVDDDTIAKPERLSDTKSNRFDDVEVQWTNINEELDMALEMVWPVIQDRGYTQLTLPDITETITIRPLFITYTAHLWLSDGIIYNIKDIKRSGDAMMTYSNKSFQFKSNLEVSSCEFTYSFRVNAIGIEVGGKIGGIIDDLLVSGGFSISAENSDISLDDFQILSFGNIGVRLKHNSIIKQLSGAILRPIVNLFKERITTLISGSVKQQLQSLIKDINDADRLKLKEFGKSLLGGLMRQ